LTIHEKTNAAVQAAIGRAISDKGGIGVQVAAYFGGEIVRRDRQCHS
jgi:hypothetical protein